MADLSCKKPKPCVPEEPKKEIYPPATEPFTQCVGDYELKWDGTRLTRKRLRTTPNGTYTMYEVVNGCVVSYGDCPEPTYTPPYCNPNPAPCQGEGGGGSVTISPAKGNTLQQTASGLFARTVINAGTGISVTGTGTVNDPYVVKTGSATGGSGSAVVGRNGLSSETEDGVTFIGIEKSPLKAGVHGLMTTDEWGRVVGYEENPDPVAKAGEGLTDGQEGDTIVIGHQRRYLEDQRILSGGYRVTIDKSGHVTAFEHEVRFPAGTYNLGAYDITINEFGTLTAITQRNTVPQGGGSFTTLTSIVTYDETGRITNVRPNPNPPKMQ